MIKDSCKDLNTATKRKTKTFTWTDVAEHDHTVWDRAAIFIRRKFSSHSSSKTRWLLRVSCAGPSSRCLVTLSTRPQPPHLSSGACQPPKINKCIYIYIFLNQTKSCKKRETNIHYLLCKFPEWHYWMHNGLASHSSAWHICIHEQMNIGCLVASYDQLIYAFLKKIFSFSPSAVGKVTKREWNFLLS